MFIRVRRSLRLVVVASVFLIAAWPSEAGAAATRQSQSDERPFRIRYELSMPRPESHLFEVKMSVETRGAVRHVDFQMPRWSPGRYAVFDFAKNVQEVRAVAGDGATRTDLPPAKPVPSLPVARLDTQTWRVETRNQRLLTVVYKVFADDLSGTFSQLDARHANYNGHSVFMYVAGHKQDPVSLRIDAPPGWKVVNGYTTRPGQTDFEFPNYDVFADAPTEIAPDWTMDTFQIEGKPYRVVVHSLGEEGGKRAALVRDIERVVREEVRLMSGAPDYEQYTFLFHFDPTARSGDGMEHLNSTQIVITRALAEEGTYEGALSTAAHEFFHVWNVKRLRPVGLGPWDFTRPVSTRGLWIAEGFTNYYEGLSLRRAGLQTDEQLFRALAGTITLIENSPGSRLMSPEESSLLASFLDRGSSEQRTNLANTAVSYYPKGETIALVLDLLVRARSRGRASLDGVMRRMYEEFYLKSPKDSYYLKGRGFTPEEFERVVSEVAGSDMSQFFARHVRAPERPPYEEALAAVGLRLAVARQVHTAGISLDFREQQQPRVGNIKTGSPAERAGLRQGDVLVRIGERDVTTANWGEALGLFKTGERVPVTARRARETISTTITLGEPDVAIYQIEKDDTAPASARAMRDAWLGGKP